MTAELRDRHHWSQLWEKSLRGLLPLDFPADVPIYICSRWELDSSVAVDIGEKAACTSHLLDLWLRDRLEAQGRWRGRGFACVIFEHCFAELDARRKTDAMLAALLHEAAHWFDCPRPEIRDKPVSEWSQTSPELADRQFVVSVQSEIEQEREQGKRPAVEPWACHDFGFIRAAWHLFFRACENGYEPNPRMMLIGGFGLNPPEQYLTELQGEPLRRINEPLRRVMADEPPLSFMRFALADLERARVRWLEAQTGAA